MPQRILVLGASGYIGQHLVRTLSQQGHQILAAARHVDRLAKLQLANVSCHKVDLNWPDNLPALLQNIDTVYFLVHSMGEGGDFIAQERQVALNVRDALREVPVKQLIFLSSLQAPPHEQSDHLRARQATADILREAGVPVTELRAGIIVGAGSAAFEVMRDMVYNLPVLTPPRWVRSHTTPIALENLLHYLVALLDHPACEHRIFEAAGPEVLSYQQQFEHFMAYGREREGVVPLPHPPPPEDKNHRAPPQQPPGEKKTPNPSRPFPAAPHPPAQPATNPQQYRRHQQQPFKLTALHPGRNI
ncbi:NAD(P)H-binding protein, partial [Escherichia coli]|uniref:NAD(P)H-binding protein n=1 Tax=Escherichia coli TaxID=562 RepID=UPI001FCE0FA5